MRSTTTARLTNQKGDNMALSSASEVFEKMPQVFNPAAASGLDVVYQFHITGEEAGDWFVVIKEGTCQVAKGVHENPSVSLTMADSDWVAMCNGTLNGMTAFMTGKLKASGDIMAAQRIPSLFPL
jgi:putative sterol carrier protein